MGNRASLIFVGFLFLLSTCVTDDGDSYKKHFIKYYGIDGDHFAADMVVNADGSIMILGTAEFPANSGLRRIYLAKVDKDGNTLWEKVFGDQTENAKDIEPTEGGYYILSNVTLDAVSGNTAIRVLRVDENGDREVGTDSLFISTILPFNYANSITAMLDGGFIVTGNTHGTNTIFPDDNNNQVDPPEATDLFSIRYDENFSPDPVWVESFGAAPEAMGIKIFEISPTELYFVGYNNNILPTEPLVPQSYDFNFWYDKLDVTGVSSGSQFYSGTTVDQEKMSAVTRTSTDEFFAVGTVTQSSGTQRVYLSRIATNFSVETGSDVRNDFLGEGIAIGPSKQNQVVVAGNVITSGGTRDIWVTKMSRDFADEPGFPITFGAAGNDDTSSAIAELPNGDIVILGTMNLVNQNKIALIRIKANGGF